MKKTLPVLLAVLVVTGFFVYVSHALMPQKGSKNTMTLPNGDVVWDLNGEWNAQIENYGPWKEFGSYPQLMKITQQESSFIGIRMMDDPWNRKGSTSMRGDLDRSGFKNVYTVSVGGSFNCNGQISEDGNKIVLDDGQKIRVTYTRK